MQLLGRAENPSFWSDDVRNKEEFKRYREELLAYWEKNDLFNKRHPALRYSEFKLFFTTGNRNIYEKEYFDRRCAIEVGVPLALIYPEDERYIERIMDMVYSICDEYTWCLPAHQGQIDTVDEKRVDLFASESAFCLAIIYRLFGDKLDSLIRDRIRYEVDRRVIEPFLAVESYGWWETGKTNWTSVCMGSVAGAMMIMHPELVTDAVIERFERSMASYLSGFKDDGVCSEGCGYWAYGFGCFLYYADMIRTFTGGRIDHFKNPKVKTVATFQQKMFLTENACVSFADGGKKLHYITGISHKLKTEYPDDVLVYDPKFSTNDMGCGRLISRLFCAAWLVEDYYNNPADSSVDFENWFENSQWYVKRNSRYSFAAKGGCNAEMHNHNDVGSFIFAKNGEQLLVDLGSGQYTRQYFSNERYNILECASWGHSLPIVNDVAQSVGAKFAARDVEFKSGVLSMDIAGAYPLSELKSLKRKFTMSDDGVTLRDEIDGDVTVVERFVSIHKPVLGEGSITIGLLTVGFDPAVCVPEISKTSGTAKVNSTIYFIDFKLPSDVKSFEITMR